MAANSERVVTSVRPDVKEQLLRAAHERGLSEAALVRLALHVWLAETYPDTTKTGYHGGT